MTATIRELPETGVDASSSRAEKALHARVLELEARLLSVSGATVCALTQLLDLKDLTTGYHSTRLAEWAVRLARILGLGPRALRGVEVAALLHDVGKIGIPDAVLGKPDSLTGEEMAAMRKHPEYGWAILRLFPDLEEASLFVLHHHEHYDGGGYPAGLSGEEIPLGARIVSVIDAFDAMIANRPYRRGLPFEEVTARLLAASGTQFDPDVLSGFLEIAHQGYGELRRAPRPGATLQV